MVTVVREAIVEREDDAFIQICCDWTKTIFFPFGFTNKT